MIQRDRITAARWLRELRRECGQLGLDLGSFFETYDRWKTKILNYFDARQTSAAVEGINNKARVITKRTYGLKSAKSLWDRLILDLNRASQAIGYSIEHIRQMAKGLKALFDLVLHLKTEAGAVRRLLAFAEPPGGLEDLSDRQIGQQPHGQHHPQDDLVRQPTAARIDPASGRERLLNVLGADHLFESRQSIQNPARVVGRQRAMSLWHASHSLLGALLVGKPKVTGGCDLRLFQRYWR